MRVPILRDSLSAGLRARARSEGYGWLFSSSGLALTDASSLGELRFGCCASGTKKNAVCAFTRVLAKTDPLSAGLRARVRWEGHQKLFSASRFAVTTRAPAILMRDGAAFHLTKLMVEWPDRGGILVAGAKPTITFTAKIKSPRHLKARQFVSARHF